MNIDFENETVGDIVRQDYRAAKVFKSHHIDFCCGGGKSLSQVCQERKLDEQVLLKELNEAFINHDEANSLDYDSWPIDLLADFIEKTHHRYVESAIPPLKQYLKKLAAVHGNSGPYLRVIEEIFNESAGNLAQHMKKEELMLFPYIRKMVLAKDGKVELSTPTFGKVENPIRMMIMEHETEGDHFKQIEELSNGYEIPDWGCNTYAVTMQLLKEFQNDLHTHIHLENNILFPKALELEQMLNDKKASPAQPNACSI